ncbi:MAG: dihydrofolate synthase, partial [Actinomycetota bacterium]|nr:dihydrofolate synthase [Actinomycetota bacterium]
IKPEATGVVQEQDLTALDVLAARADAVGAELLVEGRDFAVEPRELGVGGQRLSVRGPRARYTDLALPLFGEHQAHNAAAAIAACEAFLDRELDSESLRHALAGATSPGRLEAVSRHPLVVLDGAHNPHGARALAAALPEAFLWDRLHLVVGVLSTKDAAGIVEPLVAPADAIYACRNASPLALAEEELALACRRAGAESVSEFATVADAVAAAEAAAVEEDLILVTGSLYTVADARPRYVKE